MYFSNLFCLCVLNRFQFLKHLKHKHISRYLDICVDGRYCWISKEFVDGENLLESLTFPLHEANAQKYVNQLLVAIKYLHSLNIVHRNLKACNLMLCTDETSGERELKIVDFEYSTKVDDHLMYRDCPGNVHYVRLCYLFLSMCSLSLWLKIQ